MNKKYALPAIAMVAVIMGMSAFAPAMANPNNTHTPASVDLCHKDVSGTGDWEVITKNEHAAVAHERHGDTPVPTAEDKFWCVDNNDGTIVDPDID